MNLFIYYYSNSYRIESLIARAKLMKIVTSVQGCTHTWLYTSSITCLLYTSDAADE